MAIDAHPTDLSVFVIGATGAVGHRLIAALRRRGHPVTGMHRSDDQRTSVGDAGATPVRGDLVEDPVSALAAHMAGHAAVVFVAGAGGAGAELTTAIDEDGAKKAADAAAAADIQRFVLVSVFMDAARGDEPPNAAFEHYVAAKRAADVHLAASDLDHLIVRPGTLVDAPGTGLVEAGTSVAYGDVPRDDVATFIAASLFAPGLDRRSVEVTAGEVPIDDAVARLGRGAAATARSLTLDQAATAVEAARSEADAIGVAMNIAVVDASARLTAFARMDGAWLGSIDIAQAKAFTARAFDTSTRDLGPQVQPGQPLFGVHTTNDGHVVTFAGGIPLTSGAVVIGAVGVSGGTVDQDEHVARAAASRFAD